ncbi:heat-inducible transcriptional repressor HrcA [Waterburya agarophytonicola K14]|uniref:Heat-inducible transcription repressor HrcA n=1 Tax=Waterburya agarophytonicola KI4 TaxID=2874699 RepID=A0A964FFN9_9CYAN|nr:heat-inducible transcriptional repressor HrcA [Waterburya agarophytonicola]MCC0178000.1 heat-inducible transcriptional repressor HrcA [Waterburya agarophytonicola KI4]
MAHQPDLSARHQNILKATIKHYIATAEPVASKTLAQEYDFDVSSATIRNVMGRLEEAGLLYQPHVSAGRVPSDSGYRTYVDHLIVPNGDVSQIIQKSVQRELKVARASFEALLQKAAKILATLSGYIALITFPQNLNSTLRHLQLVRIGSDRVMLIVVTDSFQTQSILIESPLQNDDPDESNIDRQLQLLSNFLDTELKGKSLAEIATNDWSNIDDNFARYTDFFSILFDQLKASFKDNNSSPILIHGVAEFLRHPEFSQLQQVQTLLSLLEEKQEQLLPVIFTLPEVKNSLQRVSITIGEENYLEPMQSCTLISANYYQDGTPVGSVGILGPKRMLYENAIALVENTANYLSNPFKMSI